VPRRLWPMHRSAQLTAKLLRRLRYVVLSLMALLLIVASLRVLVIDFEFEWLGLLSEDVVTLAVALALVLCFFFPYIVSILSHLF
jgi:hypothetical protein